MYVDGKAESMCSSCHLTWFANNPGIMPILKRDFGDNAFTSIIICVDGTLRTFTTVDATVYDNEIRLREGKEFQWMIVDGSSKTDHESDDDNDGEELDDVEIWAHKDNEDMKSDVYTCATKLRAFELTLRAYFKHHETSPRDGDVWEDFFGGESHRRKSAKKSKEKAQAHIDTVLKLGHYDEICAGACHVVRKISHTFKGKRDNEISSRVILNIMAFARDADLADEKGDMASILRNRVVHSTNTALEEAKVKRKRDEAYSKTNNKRARSDGVVAVAAAATAAAPAAPPPPNTT
jgi:hypothetical protein